MRNDGLLLALFSMDFTATTEVSPRIIEFTVTYLANSTLFLLLAWIALACLRRMRRSDPHPSIAEITWKLTAVLPLVTAPLSMMMDGSFTRVNLSIPSLVSTSDRTIRENSVDSDFDPTTEEIVEQSEGQFTSFATNSDLTSTRADKLLDVETTVMPNQQSDVVLVESRNSSFQAEVVDSEAESQQPVIARSVVGIAPDVGLLDSRHQQSSTLQIARRSKIASVERRSSFPTYLVLAAAAILVWISLSAIYLIRKSITLNRWLKRCPPVKGGMRNQLDSLIPQGRRIRLVWAGSNSGSHQANPCAPDVRPFACGVCQWTIVMPIGIDDRLSKSELRALLAHEVAHLIRRDTVWQWIGQVLCCCLAFQPLNFVARKQWQQSGELLCDDWAIEHKVIPTLLASCLTRIAEWQLEQTTQSSHTGNLGLPAIGQSGTLTHRIHWLLRSNRINQSRRSLTKNLTTSTVFAAGILVGIVGPRLVVLPPVQAESMTDEACNVDSLRTQITRELTATETELIELQSRLRVHPASEYIQSVNSLSRRITAIREEIQE